MPSALTVLQAFERVLEPEAPIKAGRPPRRRAEEQIPQLRRHLGLAAPESCEQYHAGKPTDWASFDRCPACGEQRETIIDRLKAARSRG